MKLADITEGKSENRELWDKIRSKGVVPSIDKEKYQARDGLEGPFRLRNGKVVYYDPQEGKYYDPDTDMYIEYDDYKKMDEEADLPNKKPAGYYVMRNGQSISYHQDKESAEKRARTANMRGGSNATVVRDDRGVKEDADVGAQIADLIRKKNSASSLIARKNIDSQIAQLKKQRDKTNEEDAYDKDVKSSNKPHDKEAAAKRAKAAALAAAKKAKEQGVAEGSEIKIPTEDGITWQDIRLMAGEGKLTKKTVLQALAVIRKQRKERGVAEGDKRPDYVVKASDKSKKVKPSMGGESPHPYQGKLVGATEAEVSNTDYDFTHGKKPKGQGSWFFVAHRGGVDFGKDVEGEDYIQLNQMSYGDAKKAAVKWAKSKGHTSLFVAT